MSETQLKDALMSEISRLGLNDQKLVLEYARSFPPTAQKKTSGMAVAAQDYGFSEQDLAEMEKAILENCEQIEQNGW